MGTIFKKSATEPLPSGARVIVHKGQRVVSSNGGSLAEYFGLHVTNDEAKDTPH